MLLVLVLVALGGGLYLASHRTRGDSTAQQPANTTSPVSQEDLRQALAPLQQSINDLQAAYQRAADQTSDIRRQLSALQGEQKLLSEQVGTLSARVDRVTNAQATAPSRAAKRKRAPR
jgi:chromosome segregation ATPase